MYDAGEGYLDAIQSRNLRKEWYGDITLNNGVTIFFDKTNIKDGFGELTQRCSSDSAIDIGTVYASSLTLQFKNLGVDRYALIDAELILMADVIHMGHASAASWADVGGHTWSDYASTIWSGIVNTDTHYRFPMGVYIIKESMQTQDSIKITAYDRMLLLDKELPDTVDDNAKTPYAWIATACAACGIPLGTSRYDFYAMPNGQKTVKFANSDTETKTWRDLAAAAAALMGANLVMDRHGYLTARRYSPYARDAITAGGRYSSDFSDYQSYYTGAYLNYREGGVQDYQTNASSAAEDTGLSYDLGYNPFLQISDDTERNAMLKTFIDGQKGLTFSPFRVSIPTDPRYDLMDTLVFYDNQADSENDIAPITSIVYHFGGKTDLHCGGENPALQEVRTKEAKAIETMDSGGNAWYDDHFFMEIGSAPGSDSVLNAGTAVKVGEVLFNAVEDLVTVQIAYSANYTLSADCAVKAEIFVDEDSVYTVRDSQHEGENTFTVVTGYDFKGKGSHRASVYLTAAEA